MTLIRFLLSFTDNSLPSRRRIQYEELRVLTLPSIFFNKFVITQTPTDYHSEGSSGIALVSDDTDFEEQKQSSWQKKRKNIDWKKVAREALEENESLKKEY